MNNSIDYDKMNLNSLFIVRCITKRDKAVVLELSHVFDRDRWTFDAETLAQFKLYYVVEQLNAKVYRLDRYDILVSEGIVSEENTKTMDFFTRGDMAKIIYEAIEKGYFSTN